MKNRKLIAAILTSLALALLALWGTRHLVHRRAPFPAADLTTNTHVPPHAEVAAVSPAQESANANTEHASSLALLEGLHGSSAAELLRQLADNPALVHAGGEALCRFLREQTGDADLKRAAWIKNQVMNLLAQQRDLSVPWDDVLCGIYDDQAQHWVIRDYALQHLFEFWDEAVRTGQLRSWSQYQRERNEDIFWEALAQTDQSVAGTALLALWRLSDLGVVIDREKLAEKSAELVKGSDTGELARISALQVSAGLGDRSVLQAAVALAQAGQSIALRASAIAAVGTLGGSEALPCLERCSNDANPSVRVAVKAAMRQLRSRTTG